VRLYWRISVKREAGGAGPAGEVSNYLHDHVQPGRALSVSAPFGDLVLDAARGDGAATSPARPLLLASAGIGVTPMVSLLAELVRRDHRAPVLVVHADRTPAAHALRADQEALTDKLAQGSTHFWYEEAGAPGEVDGRIGLADLAGLEIPAGTAAFLCGPLPFMRAMREQLLAQGVSAADIHYEVFGPDLWLATV
jgi:nitric oxide dioxygenase